MKVKRRTRSLLDNGNGQPSGLHAISTYPFTFVNALFKLLYFPFANIYSKCISTSSGRSVVHTHQFTLYTHPICHSVIFIGTIIVDVPRPTLY